MRYFAFNPVLMTLEEAFQKAKERLAENKIIKVRDDKSLSVRPITGRPRAPAGCFLVRVEPDESLRIVHKNL